LYGGKFWQDERKKFFSEMVKRFGSPLNKRMTPISEILTLALIEKADHIASDETHFDPSVPMTDNEIETRACDVVEKMGWEMPVYRKGLGFADIFPRTPVPNEVQKKLFKAVDGPGIYIVEDITGGGKTEAALWSAYKVLKRMCGFLFNLPTRMTSNKMHERVEAWAEQICESGKRPMLIHGQSYNSSLPGSGILAANGPWFMPNRRAMLTAMGVSTVDQALLGVMNVKYHEIRLDGLFRKVVVLDEVHSYDAYTGDLVRELARQLYKMKCVVIILSATLTRQTKARILGVSESRLSCKGRYPMITTKKKGIIREYACGKAVSKTIDVRYVNDTAHAIRDALEAASKGVNVLWIENTVGEAALVFKSFEATLQTTKLGLLHSRFLISRRGQLEGYWLEIMGPHSTSRLQGCILVATQVIEQSVDVDFDLLVTRLCPSDFLIQRAGRIWRHLKNNATRSTWLRRPMVWILGPDLSSIRDDSEARALIGDTAKVYDLFPLMRTAQIWSKLTTVTLPDSTRRILETTYAKPNKKSSEMMKRLYAGTEFRKSKKEREAWEALSTHLPTGSDGEENMSDEVPMTRRQEVPTKQIVICREINFVGNLMRLKLYDGSVVDVPTGKVPISQMKTLKHISVRVNQNMLKVPDSGIFDDFDRTMEPLTNVVWGHAVAVRLSGKELVLESGESTMYSYTDKYGALRFK
jgi:CRISPR-associated endonuclease/helicase Cas3